MKFHLCFSLLPLISPVWAAAIPTGCSFDPQSKEYCQGTKNDASLKGTYLCGDRLLGPLDFRTNTTLGTMLDNYKPFGALCPGDFLKKYKISGQDRFSYPPQDGFQLAKVGNDAVPIYNKNITLSINFMLDRFGGEGGKFLSDYQTPYEKRSLPPGNLEERPAQPVTLSRRNNYYVYRVVKAFTVLSGPIAPWFEQPGLGIQYLLDRNVSSYVLEGYLERMPAK